MLANGAPSSSATAHKKQPSHDDSVQSHEQQTPRKAAAVGFSTEVEVQSVSRRGSDVAEDAGACDPALRKRHSIGFSAEIHDEMAERLRIRRKTIEMAELEEAAAKLSATNGSWGESWDEDATEEDHHEAAPSHQRYFPAGSMDHTSRKQQDAGQWGCYIEEGVQDTPVQAHHAKHHSCHEAAVDEFPEVPLDARTHPSMARSASPASRGQLTPPTDSEPLPGNIDDDQSQSQSRDSSVTRSWDATGSSSSRCKVQQRRSASTSPPRCSGPRPPRSWLHGDPMNPRRSVMLDEDNQFAAIQFARWATGRWEQLHELFTVDSRLATVVQRCKVTESEFALYCQRHGFDGDAHRVFREIAGEGKGRLCDAYGDSNSESRSIRLPQFLRFQRYASALAAPVVESEVEGFVNSLRQQGTLLRAWRVELDRRGKGWVTFEDLAHACRKLGCNGEARNVWSALRADGETTPLKLAELAPEEANNLEHLTEMLWNRFGFDLDRAWAHIDMGKRGAVSLDEFTRGVRQFGFDGNARLIFRGLDATGLGRLRRLDFDYLQAFLPTGSSVLSAVANAAPPIRALGAWAQEEFGGPEVFIAKLGIAESTGTEAKRENTISIKDLATALQAFGYPGDALNVAVSVARSGDGSQISGNMLLNLLTGKPKRGTEESEHSESPRSPSLRVTPTSTASSSAPFRKALWNSSVHNLSDLNESKHSSSRSYFTIPGRGQQSLCHSSSSPGLGMKKPTMRQKVEWNSSVVDLSHECAKKSRYTRTYFSVPDRAEKAAQSPNGSPSDTQKPARRRPGADSFCEGALSPTAAFSPGVRRRPGRDSFCEDLEVPPEPEPVPTSRDIVPGYAGPKTRRRPGGDSFSEEMLANMPTTAAFLASLEGGSTAMSAGGSPTTSPSVATARSSSASAVVSSRKPAPFSSAGRKYNAASHAGPSKRRTQPGEDSSEEPS